MSEWKEYRLGEIAETNAKSLSKDFLFNEIEYLDTGSITCNKIESLQKFDLKNAPSRAKRLVEHEDIIYSTVRPNQLHYGFMNYPKENLVVSTGFVTITSDRCKIVPLFLYYYLTQKQIIEFLHSIAEASTSTYPSLKPSDLESLDLLIPPLPEQKAIASVLSSLDDKIDLLHRQNTTLEAMAETLFRQYFIEEAKEDWETVKLAEEFDFIMGASPPGESYNEEGNGIPMYQGNADFGFRFPVNRVFTTEPKRFAEQNDTLISVRAPVGAQNMAIERCCIGRGVAAFKYKKDNSFYSYTFYKLKSLMSTISQFNETGTVFGSISKSDLESLNVVSSDTYTIESFQKVTKPIDEKIKSNSYQINILSKLRDSLLPKLMSGEVRVRE